MAKKFIVVSGLDTGSIARCFGINGKAPRASICPRFRSFSDALAYAKGWPVAGYHASILRPLKGGGWVEVCFLEADQ